MDIKIFCENNQAAVAPEYVVFVAAVGILLIVGVGVLFTSMSGLFNGWASYFNVSS
jgi:Flp pilus assembly pilin Flp